MNRNKRLYRCDECDKLTFFSKREENRVARIRCPACGSARLVVSRRGADLQAKANDANAVAAAMVNKNGSGSVVPQ
jgi:DNA-directed RNA polymerase subunit RPC12/RpoP